MGVIDLMQIWWLLISINWISLTKEMNPITRKSMSKLVMQPSFRAVGQTHTKWKTFEKPKNKRHMYGSRLTHARLPYVCLLFSGFSNVYYSAWLPTTVDWSYQDNRFELGLKPDPASWLEKPYRVLWLAHVNWQVCCYWFLVNRSRGVNWHLL